MYLSISVRQLIYWIFTTNIPGVSRRASWDSMNPKAHWKHNLVQQCYLGSGAIGSVGHGHRSTSEPCAHELVLQDSNCLINNPELRIKMKTFTIHKLRTLLHPQKLIQVFKDLAPFMWQILHTFCASPNNNRRRQAVEIAVSVDDLDEDDPMSDADSEDEEGWADDPNLESGQVDPNSVPSHWS
jgi:hypothetical protein